MIWMHECYLWLCNYQVNDNFVMDDIPFNESLASNNRLMQFVNISILLGGLSYMGYHFLRSYLIPTFFKIRDATEDHSDRIQQLQTKVISCLNFLHVFNFYLIRFLIRWLIRFAVAELWMQLWMFWGWFPFFCWILTMHIFLNWVDFELLYWFELLTW